MDGKRNKRVNFSENGIHNFKIYASIARIQVKDFLVVSSLADIVSMLRSNKA